MTIVLSLEFFECRAMWRLSVGFALGGHSDGLAQLSKHFEMPRSRHIRSNHSAGSPGGGHDTLAQEFPYRLKSQGCGARGPST